VTRAPFFSKAFRRHVPVLRQAEMTECGLACLAMVLAHYGAAVEIGVMRRQYPASARGTSLSGLATIAKNFGCETAGVRANLEELAALRMPCILHWNLNHFVVLVAVKKHAVVIHDPERGRVVVSMADASKAFTGGVLEIRPTAQFVPTVGAGAELPWCGRCCLHSKSCSATVRTACEPVGRPRSNYSRSGPLEQIERGISRLLACVNTPNRALAYSRRSPRETLRSTAKNYPMY
jgi:predicted double-glycine peptidase